MLQPGAFAFIDRECDLPARGQFRIDRANHPQPSVFVADRNGVFDLPVRFGAERQVTGDLSDGILFGALAAAAIIAHGIGRTGVDRHGDGEADCRIGRDTAGRAARNDRRDLDRRVAAGQQNDDGQRPKLHCNDPQRAVAGSAEAHFQVMPSWQIVAV